MIGNVTINVNGREIRAAVQKLNSDIVSLTENPSIKRNINDKFAELVNPYVPMRSGALRQDVTVDANGIEYTATSPYNGYKYAGLQYYETSFNHTVGTDHWASVAKPYVWDSLVQFAESQMKRGAKDIG